MFKKAVSMILTIALVISALTVPAFAESAPPELSAEGVLLIDLTTGEVLYEKDPDKQLYPASTTKMMTALLVMENLNLNTTLKADADVASTGGTRLGMKAGEQISAKDALYEMLIGSCNDLAVLLAKAVAGTVEDFAVMMNEKAKEIGCTNTHFVNPSGLHDENHYTTANDLALIAVYCMKKPEFREIVKRSTYTYVRGKGADNPGATETMSSSNWLLNDTSHYMYVGDTRRTPKYDGCIGIKTGWTSQAKGCLVGAATKNGTTLMSVVLKSNGSTNGSYERFIDSIKLLDWGFANYRTYQAASMGKEMGTIAVRNGEFNKVRAVLSTDVYTTLTTLQKDSEVTTQVRLDNSVTAPFDQGTPCGKMDVFVDGQKVGEYDIITASAIKKGGILSVFGIEDATAKKIFAAALIILVVAVVVFIVNLAMRKVKSDKKRARKAAEVKARREELERKHAAEEELERFAAEHSRRSDN